MTFKELLASLGITNIDKEITTDSSITEPAPAPAPAPVPSSINEPSQNQQENQQTVDPRIAAMEKEIQSLKEANARLLSQTPVQHQQTPEEALVDLLGIGVKNNGTTEGTT